MTKGSSKIISLTCNHCGAPLEVPEETRFLTCSYCSARLQVEQGKNAVYTKVLEQIEQKIEQHAEAVADDLEVIKLQNKLERIDREWAMEKEQYMIRGQHGEVNEPSGGFAGILIGIFGICFGILWTVIAATVFPPMAFFGLVFIGIAIFNLISTQNKASNYDAARMQYGERRSKVLNAMNQK